MSNQIPLRECASYSYCARLWCQQTNPSWKKNFPSVWKCSKIWSTWEVWRALKKLELLLATPRATLTHLLCSPNFPHASYLDECMLTYEPIVNYIICRVIDGLETLDDLEKLPVNEKTYRPLTEVRIKNVTIHANPIADKSGWINPTGKLRCKPTTTYCLLPNKDSGVCYQTSNTGGNNFTIKQRKMQQKTILTDCVKKTFYFGTNFV